ncbi:hypothetical protein FA15DRAFT_610416 [Coprinopsis marcescibilis]|uniref:Uncharacterized protein n=1 Tax=Coprinopsis marcescibilis TaxID=230819 RepID=A0A5C3L9G1_COPMA|nr:hypothetical protein FA15DRAFT_610416 [Coprinopsis marcescibilis]
MSTSLPSFVELMASLGLEQKPTVDDKPQSPDPQSSPKLDADRTAPSPVKAKSSPSLRDIATRQKTSRYSPYSPVLPTRRRGSLSSVSSSSSGDASPTNEAFVTRPRSPRTRRHRNPLCLNIYGSTSDLPANMPISTYVRRKTPATTPTSPTFPRETGGDSTSDIPMPLTIPVLPSALLPNSASSESFPLTPNDFDASFPEHTTPLPELKQPHIWDLTESGRYSHFTGVRISNASRCSLNEQHIRRTTLVDAV